MVFYGSPYWWPIFLCFDRGITLWSATTTRKHDMNNPPRYRFQLRPEDSSLISQSDVAMQLELSPGRIAELVTLGNIAASPDGLIELAELERCRTDPAVVSKRRGGRPKPDRDDAAAEAQLALVLKWANVAVLMRPICDLPAETWRGMAPPLVRAMKDVGITLQP